MNPRYLRSTCIWAGLFSVAFAGLAAGDPHPRILWNASASAPIGLYRVDGDATPAVGDLLVLMPPKTIARFIAERRYLPGGVPLLKQVAAMPGQHVCRTGADILVDSIPVAVARARDRIGRMMPVWQGCQRISADELFLLNPAADSLDGRYFGPVPASGVVGVAHPVMTRSSPREPLRWHRVSHSRLFKPMAKEHQQ
ncbi:MAG: S26 family signal peptidase [Blastomonas fulva]|jgi:conjugative transfer signal peptidase TraF|uniref:S26 family signal peptidase n=1 Tax=Blastomonas fulva TaxID=1550728 RepID=UPI00403317AF